MEPVFQEPSVFHANRGVYEDFVKNSVQHTRGFFILAPSGTGKTYFVNHQEEKHWIDGDSLWVSTGAHPNTDWWTKGMEVIKEVDARSDVVTQEAKRLGLWILGASNNWLRPDAVVLPPWETNVAYIQKRQETNYDGGLTMNQLGQLEAHRNEILEMSRIKNVPIFQSIDEAALYIEKIYLEG